MSGATGGHGRAAKGRAARTGGGAARRRKEEFFDRWAERDDPMSFRPDDAPRLALLRKRLGDLAGLRVLEPGCGAGHLTAHLAEWTGPAGSVVAFDPCGRMIERARTRAGGARNVEFRRTSIESAAFAAGGFDRIVCFRVWPHFDDGFAVLARCARWLAPGGRLVVVHWEGRAGLAAIHGAHPSLADDLFPPRADLEAAFARAGFAIRRWIDDEDEIYIEAVRETEGTDRNGIR